MCTRVLSICVCPSPPPVHTHVQCTISGLALCWEALSCPQMSPHPEVTHRAVVPHCGRSRPAVPHSAPCCPIVSRCAPPHPFIPTALCWAPLCPTVPHGAVLCPLVSYCAPLCCTASHCAPLCPLVPHCALLCPVISHCAPLCPIVPCCAHLYPIVPHCAILGHTVPHCAPLRPVVPYCAHLYPPCPTVHRRTLLCPVISHCALLLPTASLHPAVPHCIPLCPTAPCRALLFPSVAPLCTIPHHGAPLRPTVPHGPPRGALGLLQPPTHPTAQLPSRHPGTVARGRAGRGWSPPFPVPPPGGGPLPATPLSLSLRRWRCSQQRWRRLCCCSSGLWQASGSPGTSVGTRLGVPHGEGGGGTPKGWECQWESWVNPSCPWGRGGLGRRGQGGPLCVVGAG